MRLSDFPFIPDEVEIAELTRFRFTSTLDEEGNEIRANRTPSTSSTISVKITGNAEKIKDIVRYYKSKKGKLESFTLPDQFWRNVKDTNLLTEISQFYQPSWIFTGQYKIIPIVSDIYEIKFVIKNIIEEKLFYNQPNYSLRGITSSFTTKILKLKSQPIPIIRISSATVESNTPLIEGINTPLSDKILQRITITVTDPVLGYSLDEFISTISVNTNVAELSPN